MKLATLAFEIAKESIEIPSGMTEETFINGTFDDDRDFNSQISFAFNYINLAFTRLFTGNKTLLKVSSPKISDASGYIQFEGGEVISVATSLGVSYDRVQFLNYNKGIAVEKDYVQKVVYIEYKPYIPHFGMDSIRRQALDDNNEEIYEAIDVELSDYGITDEMCSYVKEYAKGGLMEYLSPELSQRHTQMAENYFSALKTRYTQFPQRRIKNVNNGGGIF